MQQRMDILTILGIVLGLGLVIGAIAMEGSLAVFWSPSSLMITVGGSFAALLVNFQIPQVKMVLQVTKQAFMDDVAEISDIINLFVR